MNVIRAGKLILAIFILAGLFTVRSAAARIWYSTNGSASDIAQSGEYAAQVGSEVYRDDRSDAVAVLTSLYNAINRKEYLRAYSYWKPSNTLPSFAQFERGYANTASVQLATGVVSGDAGAGQFRYTVPVVIRSINTNGTVQRFAGCYTLHLSSSAAQATPPFRPMSIESSRVRPVSNNASTAQLLRQGCPSS